MSQTTVSTFWVRWLLVMCGVGVLFGLILVIAPDLFQNVAGSLYYNSVFDYDAYAELSDAALVYQNWSYGLLGSAMVGWILLIALIVRGPFRRGERWSWTAITISLVVWFVLDTTISLTSGVTINALLNTGFLVGFGVPLLMTAGAFRQI